MVQAIEEYDPALVLPDDEPHTHKEVIVRGSDDCSPRCTQCELRRQARKERKLTNRNPLQKSHTESIS